MKSTICKELFVTSKFETPSSIVGDSFSILQTSWCSKNEHVIFHLIRHIRPKNVQHHDFLLCSGLFQSGYMMFHSFNHHIDCAVSVCVLICLFHPALNEGQVSFKGNGHTA